MKYPIKRCFALLAAMAAGSLTAAALPAETASAAEQSSLLIMGDSIASGYGLKNDEMSYADYLREFTGGTVTNLAVPGYTTFDLISQLDDAKNAETIKSADIICISIGANDLLKPTRDYFNDMREEGETAMQLLQRLASEHKAEKFISGLTGVLREPRNQAVDNYPVIAEKLRKLNPNARIMMQTIYNPYELPLRYFYANHHDDSDYQDYTLFTKYVAGNLAQLNKAMGKLEGFEVADVSAAFAGDGWVFCKILSEQDVHPNALGHALIGAVIMDKLSGVKKTFPTILPLLGKVDYSDYLRMNSKSRTSLMNYTEGQLTGKFGDANSDNQILIDDAQAVLNLYTDQMAFKSIYGEGVTYAGFSQIDVNLDNSVSVEDAQFILTYYVENHISGGSVTWADITGNPKAPKE